MQPICLLPPIKFLLKKVYGLEDDDVWRILRWLFSAKKSLIANGMVLAISESPCCLKLSIKFLLKKIYGLEEDVGWRIPRWLFSDWPSLICEWGDLSYSESLCCLTHPTKILFKRRYGLEEMLFKEQQDCCKVLGHLRYLNGMILFILNLHVAWCLSSSFFLREYMSWKKLIENSKKAV